MCSLLRDLHIFVPDPPLILCDNKSSIALASNPVSHSRMKHLAIDFHFVRELVHNKTLQVEYISTDSQVADALTKGLSAPRFDFLKHKLHVLKPH